MHCTDFPHQGPWRDCTLCHQCTLTQNVLGYWHIYSQFLGAHNIPTFSSYSCAASGYEQGAKVVFCGRLRGSSPFKQRRKRHKGNLSSPLQTFYTVIRSHPSTTSSVPKATTMWHIGAQVSVNEFLLCFSVTGSHEAQAGLELTM